MKSHTCVICAMTLNINISTSRINITANCIGIMPLSEINIYNSDIVNLLALVLRCNNFEFNRAHFLQIQGVAMGTRVALKIASYG